MKRVMIAALAAVIVSAAAAPVEMRVENGSAQIPGQFKSTYGDRMTVSPEGEMIFDNHDPGGARRVTIDLPELVEVPGRRIVAEWKMRLPDTTAPRSFELSLGLATGTPKTLNGFFFFFGAGGITLPEGKLLKPEGLDLAKPHEFRLEIINDASRKYTLFCDGKLLTAGRAPLRRNYPVPPFAFFGDSSPTVTGKFALSYFRIGELPAGEDHGESAEIAVRDGKEWFSPECRSNYGKRLGVSKDGKIVLDHSGSDSKGWVEFELPTLLNDPKRLTAVEWKMRMLSPGDTRCCELSIETASGTPGVTYGFFFVFAGNSISMPDASAVKLPGVDLMRSHTYRLVCNNGTGAYDLWCDGEVIRHGQAKRLHNYGRPPFALIGDTSKLITGKFELDCFRIREGKLKTAAPAARAAATALLPAGADWPTLRRAALDRKRLVIYNDDGDDALYLPDELPATPENFTSRRLAYTRGTTVDTVFYCPVSSGFGHLTYDTKAGDPLLATDPDRKGYRNITGELIAQGTSPVREAERFCRREGREFFVSLRMNDTHDGGHTEEKPFFLMSPFKRKNPQFLLGSRTDRLRKCCTWSAVDYTHKEVRDRMKSIVAEVCEKFDVDGLEYDYMRHMQLLKSVARGGRASQAELDMMTRFMRELREITEAAGKKRGRPILIAVHLPDSVEYCRAVGVDLERWMKEDLFDMYIAAGYFQLKPWRDSVALARRYGKKIYASLDESRLAWKLRRVLGGRNKYEFYFARVAAAMAAGCDGVSYFNLEYENLRNVASHSPGRMINSDSKLYFVTERGPGGYRPESFLVGGRSFYRMPLLAPQHPQPLEPGRSFEYEIFAGDDFTSPVWQEGKARAELRLLLDDGSDPAVTVNGVRCGPFAGADGFLTAPVDPKCLRRGVNRIAVSHPEGSKEPLARTILAGDKLLAGSNQPPWRRLWAAHDEEHSERIVDGAYEISDTGGGEGECANLLYPFDAVSNLIGVSFEMKLKSTTAPDGAVLRVADGKNVEMIRFEPDRITAAYSGRSAKFKTDDRFHRYELAFADGKFTFKADGKVLFDRVAAAMTTEERTKLRDCAMMIPHMDDRSLLLGSLSGPGRSVSGWRAVTLHTAAVPCLLDMALALDYPRQPDPQLDIEW